MHGFGSHTFSFINAKNERYWVKFHFRSQQGIKNVTDAEAEAIVGKDRESHQRDLYASIEKGDFPKWTRRRRDRDVRCLRKITGAMRNDIPERQFYMADQAYSEGLAKGFGLPAPPPA
jgi:hypothetical protein